MDKFQFVSKATRMSSTSRNYSTSSTALLRGLLQKVSPSLVLRVNWFVSSLKTSLIDPILLQRWLNYPSTICCNGQTVACCVIKFVEV